MPATRPKITKPRRKPRAAKVAANSTPPAAAPCTPQQRAHQRVRRSASWPADWKQALWERFAPTWALLRWPVRYEERTWWELQPCEGATATWSPAVPIEPGTLMQGGNGEVIGIALGASQPAVSVTNAGSGLYSYARVDMEPSAPVPEDHYRSPRQHGWDDAAAGQFAPEQYGPVESTDNIAYCYGWTSQKAGKPWPTSVE